MSRHLTEEEVARYADGELAPAVLTVAEEHLRECSHCASAVLSAVQLKRAIREAMPRRAPRRPLALPGQRSRAPWWLAAAALLVLLLGGGLSAVARSRAAARELVDLHTTILAGSNPIDVLSTDRHTVKPWFEGRVPFAVEVPELDGTSFRLIGGRLVFWRSRPAAYLLIGKGAHRISLFEFDSTPILGSVPGMTMEEWSAGGLSYVAVGDVPRTDLQSLRRRF
jgi:anti-sigma factor RsiW